MLEGISLLNKKRFFRRKINQNNEVFFLQFLIPLILVIISSLLIKSIQRFSQSVLSHLSTGLFGYLYFISYTY